MSAKTSAYWLDIADYDLDTAEAMYSTGRWLYVAFMCHQVIEKTIKAYWCATMPDEPPYTHNHKRLIIDETKKLQLWIKGKLSAKTTP